MSLTLTDIPAAPPSEVRFQPIAKPDLAAIAAFGARVAREIREAFAASDRAAAIEHEGLGEMARWLADDSRDLIAQDIITALKTGPLKGFDIRTAAVVEGRSVEATIIVKYDGQVRHLTTLESAALACVIRLEPGLRGAPMFADAFRMAAIEASTKVDNVHTWSRGIRPTEDAE